MLRAVWLPVMWSERPARLWRLRHRPRPTPRRRASCEGAQLIIDLEAL